MTQESVGFLIVLTGVFACLAFTYVLPASAKELELRADWPVDELRLYIDRGVVEATPDPALVSQGEIGPPEQPRLSYAVSDLPADSSVRLAFRSGGVDWRQRLGVVLATTITALAALLWVWLRGRPVPDPSPDAVS